MKVKELIRGPLGLAIAMLVICGFIFPVVVTGVGQGLFHYQANGSLAEVNNTTVGSYLVGQSTDSPYLFHIRNDSASGIDPDITVANATMQAHVIHNETGVSMAYLGSQIHNNTKYTMFFFGTAYVDALTLNLHIIEKYHGTVSQYGSMYRNITGS